MRGRIIKFDGHTRVQGPLARKDGDIALPDIGVAEFGSDQVKFIAAFHKTPTEIWGGEFS